MRPCARTEHGHKRSSVISASLGCRGPRCERARVYRPEWKRRISVCGSHAVGSEPCGREADGTCLSAWRGRGAGDDVTCIPIDCSYRGAASRRAEGCRHVRDTCLYTCIACTTGLDQQPDGWEAAQGERQREARPAQLRRMQIRPRGAPLHCPGPHPTGPTRARPAAYGPAPPGSDDGKRSARN